MYQFFVTADQVGKEYVTITGSDAHHIRDVVRLREGEEIRVSTGSGESYLCIISEIGAEFVQADILSEAVSTELPAEVILYQALPKGDRMETVIEKAVELGVASIVPVAMKYCVVRLDQKKAEAKVHRWQGIAESAAKQSKRSRVPRVRPVLSFSEALSDAKECDRILLPYENENGMKGTEKVLKTIRPRQRIAVFIGPEGGFAPEELSLSDGIAERLSLGRRILRTDTAAITTLSLIMITLETCGRD